CYLAVLVRPKTGLDDSLDVFSVHGIGGVWGAIATGIFASVAVSGAGGLLEGNAGQMGPQFAGVAATFVWSAVATLVILKVLDVIPGLGLRAPPTDEDQGMDVAAHGERAVVHDGAV